jgi:transcriptional regulator with XRE-family HTH domain
MDEKETVQGYEIKQCYLFGNNRGFALAVDYGAPAPFVTWQYTEENGARDYYWGHYFLDEYNALKDFTNRVTDYMKDFRMEANEQYRYYATQRPVSIGTIPKTDHGPISITPFESRAPVEHEHFEAWGYLEYSDPLTQKQINDFELRPSSRNTDRMKLEEQTQTVGKWEQAHRVPDVRRLTWWYSDFGVFVAKEFVTPEKLKEISDLVIASQTRAAEKRMAKKPIAQQLAEAGKQAERENKTAPAKKHSKSHDDR